MCVVRVDSPKIPKLQTACTTPVSDGMVVTTESKEVEETRAAMIEGPDAIAIELIEMK